MIPKFENLAVRGGTPVIDYEIPKYKWTSSEVSTHVASLVESNEFSGFLANPGTAHLGGRYVKSLESFWGEVFDSSEVISFNSWTSGLVSAVRALNLEPNSEVLVTPWTMSASVTAIIANNLRPVFCDISTDDFNIDVSLLESLVSKNTSAILGVDIFGRPANFMEIKKIVDKYGLAYISDAAQTPAAKLNGLRSCDVADVGGYSLNRHKHLPTGEGGIAVTSNKEIGDRLRLLRNHGEISCGDFPNRETPFGFNLRMGEFEALLAIDQLKNFDHHINMRRNAGKLLANLISENQNIRVHDSQDISGNDYYILGLSIDSKELQIDRHKIVEALRSEGVPGLLSGYQLLSRVPAFAPFAKEKLVVAENFHDLNFIGVYLCGLNFSNLDIEKMGEAFNKVFSNLNLLRS